MEETARGPVQEMGTATLKRSGNIEEVLDLQFDLLMRLQELELALRNKLRPVSDNGLGSEKSGTEVLAKAAGPEEPSIKNKIANNNRIISRIMDFVELTTNKLEI